MRNQAKIVPLKLFSHIFSALFGILILFSILAAFEVIAFGVLVLQVSANDREKLLSEFHPLLRQEDGCPECFRNPLGAELGEIYEFDSARGHRNKPNSTIPVEGEFYSELGVDEYGFVHNGDPNRNLSEKPSNVFRIITLGGSSMQGIGATSNSSTVSAVLERTLNDQASVIGQSFQVINAGVGGYSSAQELTYFALDLLQYEPDMLIVWNGNNDASIVTSDWREVGGWTPNRSAYQAYLEQQIPKLVTPRGAFENFLHSLRIKSELFQHISDPNNYYSIRLLQNTNKRFTHASQQIQDNEIEEYRYSPEAVELYEQNVKAMIGICWANEIRCVVLLQPVLHIPTKKPLSDYEVRLNSSYPPEYVATATKYWEAYHYIFGQLHDQYHDGNGFWIEDTTEIFDNENETTFMDHVHLSDRGQQLIAERIRKIVIEMLTVDG